MDTSQATTSAVSEVVHVTRADPQAGLLAEDAAARQRMDGPNELESAEKETLLSKYVDQFKDPMIGMLMASAGISLLLKQYDDAASIALAVVIVSTVAFVQEYKSEQALAALEDLVPPRANVLRNGMVVNLDARELVVGDTLVLAAGDKVAADARIVESVNLTADESSLTGESHARAKDASPTSLPSYGGKAPLAECHNMAFMGTLITGGNGRAVVTATAMRTEFGATFAELRDMEDPKTPLQVTMDKLGHQLSMASFAIIGLISLVGWLRGRPLLEMFQIGVSLAVAAIPEGLPICVTVTLALGVMRMAKRNAIVKKLPAVEALGCASVVCVDKTGTLTQNRQVVVEVYSTAEGVPAPVTGEGYRLEGRVHLRGRPISAADSPAVAQLVEAACLCNNAQLRAATRSGEPELLGQPTEGAILVLAAKLGAPDPRLRLRRLRERPFSSEEKLMLVACEGAGPRAPAAAYAKGSPGAVLALCSAQAAPGGGEAPLGPRERENIEEQCRGMGARGLRVLAVATGPAEALDGGGRLVLLGLLAMRDPPRPRVREAVGAMRGGGVRVVMVTGDAMETAMAIGRDIGLPCGAEAGGAAMSGHELEAMGDAEREIAVRDVSVFYRLSPRHKVLIVKALQRNGEVVGMTGDGVNDASALRAAQIGVAMGLSGTDVAKEAGDMVLLDDDFATILPAVEEGKAIFHNIRNFLTFQLSTSVAALSLISFSTLFGYANPLNAMQILWINIIMDGPPAQSLGVEPVDDTVRSRPPRRASDPIITRRLLARVLSTAALVVVGTLHVFLGEIAADGQVNRRDTTITFTTFVAFDMVNAYCCRSETKPFWRLGVASNAAFLYAVGMSIVAQLAVIYVPFFQSIFQTEALTAGDLLYVLAIASSLFLLDTARKAVATRERRAKAPRAPSRGVKSTENIV